MKNLEKIIKKENTNKKEKVIDFFLTKEDLTKKYNYIKECDHCYSCSDYGCVDPDYGCIDCQSCQCNSCSGRD